MIKLPKKIKVGYKFYDVNTDIGQHELYDEEFEDASWGITMADERIFSFRTVGCDDEKLRETVLHELLHACFDMAHIKIDHESEEHIVGALSKTLFGIFKENNGLLEIIGK